MDIDGAMINIWIFDAGQNSDYSAGWVQLTKTEKNARETQRKTRKFFIIQQLNENNPRVGLNSQKIIIIGILPKIAKS